MLVVQSHRNRDDTNKHRSSLHTSVRVSAAYNRIITSSCECCLPRPTTQCRRAYGDIALTAHASKRFPPEAESGQIFQVFERSNLGSASENAQFGDVRFLSKVRSEPATTREQPASMPLPLSVTQSQVQFLQTLTEIRGSSTYSRLSKELSINSLIMSRTSNTTRSHLKRSIVA